MIVAIVALLALDVFAVAYGWSVRRAQKAHMTEPRTSLGAIVATNSGGRFDLVVYEDGILAVEGTYWLLAGSARGNETYERTRLSKLLERPRSEVLADDPNNHFIPVETIVGLVLRKRWHGHSLTIRTKDQPAGRKYSWKPALNKSNHVRSMLQSKFGESLAIE